MIERALTVRQFRDALLVAEHARYSLPLDAEQVTAIETFLRPLYYLKRRISTLRASGAL